MPNAAGTADSTAAAKTILMLEDDADVAEILAEFFKSEGFAVTHAVDGVDGLKRIMAEDFNLILCDMHMPRLAGDMFYAAVERVKPNLCNRFIFMTGHQADPKWSAFVKRIDGTMLFKPFELHVLIESVNSVLRKTQQT